MPLDDSEDGGAGPEAEEGMAWRNSMLDYVPQWDAEALDAPALPPEIVLEVVRGAQLAAQKPEEPGNGGWGLHRSCDRLAVVDFVPLAHSWCLS